MNSITIDVALCNGCKTCMKACFVDVIRWDDKQKKPVVAYREDCVACNACEAWCPKKCITVVPDLPGDFERFPKPY
jgi:NAD-dependent dihydropyrimidine dehydrogenase PreA subunit